MLPWMLMPLARLLRWGRERLKAITGQPGTGRDGSLDVGGALLLVGTITLAATLGVPLVVTLGGGIGMAILFVVVRSWVVVQEQQTAWASGRMKKRPYAHTSTRSPGRRARSTTDTTLFPRPFPTHSPRP
ncbi:MAG: hypothetical protein BRD43_02130 [Bacteroidetes bacterium QS_4_64_154]|nr:MAG: hypothetical protein BRD43_02130 [Bacteroidetes bacterium QS_4_64_154]